MSVPPSGDGTIGDDAFYNISNAGEVPHLLTQTSDGAAGVPMSPPHLMWQNQLQGAQYVHTQQQQNHYNDFLYNMHPQPAFTATAGKQETYSVLPVGHGNFLKVYHCPETSGAGLSSDNSLYHQHQSKQHQCQTFHQQQPPYQVPQPQSAPPTQQIYNSYELFSSTTLMPPPDSQANFDCESPIQPQQNPLFLINNATLQANNTQVNPSTNMIINKLVNNWSPNLTGDTYSQFGSSVPQIPPQNSVNNGDLEVPPVQGTVLQLNNNNNNNNNGSAIQAVQPLFNQLDKAATPIVTSNLPQQKSNLAQQPLKASVLPENHDVLERPPPNTSGSYKEVVVNPLASVVQPTYSAVPEVKKRIVAEVKPMRMTYSDVLSKFNNQQAAPTQALNTKSHTARNGKMTAAFMQSTNDRKAEASNLRRSANTEESNSQPRNSKKSPVHESKEHVPPQVNAVNNKNAKRSATIQTNGSVNNTANVQQKQAPTQTKQPTKSNVNDNNKKRGSSKRNGENDQQSESSKQSKPSGGLINDKDYSGFYNVAAKNNESFRRQSKSANSSSTYQASSSNSTSNAHIRKASKTTSNYYINSTSTPGGNQNQSRVRYSNTASNNSYSYSSKRNRGSNFSSSYGGSTVDAPNPNVELAKKFLRAWFEYTLMILHWLFYLVYDIIVLGFSRVYEQLIVAYDYGIAYVQQLRKDLKQNSNKPSIWLKECWRRFDGKFKKDSRWAIWRRFYKRKPPEATTETFKSGRLPQTGEEAMYSLLNCKGKDAYSILGVPPDSSQEQIRKHYKKIAVLVHPDKNKQAGAEEAFKVLQRAFELIGEPENRRAYDQSLAEALHAEKAWTELHDLLSQLQTKITEAANTIRCSTCGLRHPRKLTDRPHYAARECTSCKIRHSAREGDIWAETSFLGLRWKYLALMEGKVYDITEWANCQKGALSHLEPNSHMVQYRIVRGAQQQQQQQQPPPPQQQQQQQQASQNYHHHSPHHNGQQYPHGVGGSGAGNGKFKRDIPSDDSLHDFLDNLYSGQHPNQSNSASYSNASRRRTRRN